LVQRVAADSSTNLAWLINQNTPSTRIDSAGQAQKGGDLHREADFAGMTIVPEMLDR
jgi:hypothetical protein